MARGDDQVTRARALASLFDVGGTVPYAGYEKPARAAPPEVALKAAHAHKADIALRVLMNIQNAIRAPAFDERWRPPPGAVSPQDAKLMLIRRLWVHALLANHWLSVNDLERITKRPHLSIETDRDTIVAWCKASRDFADIVHEIEELADTTIALIASSDRMYAIAPGVALEARRIRALAKLPRKPPSLPAAR